MNEIATTAAPNGAIAMSLAIIRVLGRGSPLGYESNADPGPLPEPFNELDLDSLLTVVSKIGALATITDDEDTPVAQDERLYSGAPIQNNVSCAEAADMVDAADRIIRNWPMEIDALIASIADRNPQSLDCHPVQSIFATQAGYRLLGKIRSVDGEVIGVIDDALESWLLRERDIYIDGRQRAKVGVGGDVAIDVADATRRLEGRTAHPLAIRAWLAAGAVAMIGRSVSLASVDATVDRIANLEVSEFSNSMSVEDWSSRFLYNENYARSDAIRDVLSGEIRVRRTLNESRLGLASLQICSEDFLQCAQDAAKSAKMQGRSLARKAKRAREADGFYRSGQLRALLTGLWPEHHIPNMTEESAVRSRTEVRRYYGRDMKQQLYSVADALDLMEAMYPIAA